MGEREEGSMEGDLIYVFQLLGSALDAFLMSCVALPEFGRAGNTTRRNGTFCAGETHKT